MIEVNITVSYGLVRMGCYGKEDLPDTMDGSAVAFSQREMCRLWNLPQSNVHCLNQVHGKTIHCIPEGIFEEQTFAREVPGAIQSVIPGSVGKDGDGLVSEQEGHCLVIRTADCVPLVVWAYNRPLVGAIHSGWKGTHLGILEAFIERFARPDDELGFCLFPRISGESYEVGEEVAQYFNNSPFLTAGKVAGKFQLDLGKEIYRRICKIRPNATVLDFSDDTKTRSEWFSHRRGDVGRNLSGIGFFRFPSGL